MPFEAPVMTTTRVAAAAWAREPAAEPPMSETLDPLTLPLYGSRLIEAREELLTRECVGF